jgi:predicted transcriptional regulator
MDYRPTTINLTPELDDALDREAAAMGVTRSALMRIALQAWIQDGSTPGRSPPASAGD